MRRYRRVLVLSLTLVITIYIHLHFNLELHTLEFMFIFSLACFAGYQWDRAQQLKKTSQNFEENYKRLIDAFPEGIVIHADRRILYANKAAASMLGIRCREELLNRNIFSVITREYHDRLHERIKILGKVQLPMHALEYQYHRNDGATLFVEVASVQINFNEKKAILSIATDVTKKKEETNRLIQKSEKLALLGQMAAGIAHEIRNPLTSIKGFVQLFRGNTEQVEYYDLVLSELDRINQIVGEFLVLSKPSTIPMKEVKMNVLLDDVLTLMRSHATLHSIVIHDEMAEQLPSVLCEENQIKQVFINILKNAIEAMPDGGTIYVHVDYLPVGKLTIQIRDEGVGISPERLQTIGEPFYTTKEKGTGLGLMTCFKIIESHQGELKFQSEVLKGTTVEVTLPTIIQPYLK